MKQYLHQAFVVEDDICWYLELAQYETPIAHHGGVTPVTQHGVQQSLENPLLHFDIPVPLELVRLDNIVQARTSGDLNMFLMQMCLHGK